MSKELSLKERLYIRAKKLFPTLSPVTGPMVEGSLLFEPFKQYELNAGWQKYLKYINSTSDKAKITNFGKHVGLDEARSFAREIIKDIQDSELLEAEQAELLEDEEVRGSGDGYMYHGRILAYDPKCYNRRLDLPSWALPKIPDFVPLTTLADVEINEPHANTGYPDLRPLFPRGERNSALYNKYLLRGQQLVDRVWVVEHPSTTLMQSLVPPIAMFWREQSGRRPIWAASKVMVIPEMAVTQPCQRVLEGEAWYAYGDRAARFEQMRKLLDAPAGTAITDGDDLAGKLADGRIFNGDASAFDASVSKDDMNKWTDHVIKAARCTTTSQKQFIHAYKAINDISLSLVATCGVGRVTRLTPHGLISGKGDTHIAGSWIEYARWLACKPWSTPAQVVDAYTKVGGVMNIKKQRITKHSVELSKLYCTSDTLHGLVTRGIYSLAMYEDIPSIYFGPDDDDARVIAIVANTWAPEKPHPCWSRLCDWVKKHWELRGDKQRVMSLAVDKVSKRRLFQADSGRIAGWEKRALDATWLALS